MANSLQKSVDSVNSVSSEEKVIDLVLVFSWRRDQKRCNDEQ